MPKFRVKPWLQLNNIGVPASVTLWLLMTIIRESCRKVVRIQLHEK